MNSHARTTSILTAAMAVVLGYTGFISNSAPSGSSGAIATFRDTNAEWDQLHRELAEMDGRIATFATELAEIRQQRLSGASAPRGI
jgi:hypothetical protein